MLHLPSGLVLNLDKCYQVSTLSMNMIRSCSLQYGYSFKLENNGYSVYMNNTFHGHAPYVNGSLNLVALPPRSYWRKMHEETPCRWMFGVT